MSKFTEVDLGILVGGQPTEGDLEMLKEEGVRTVIDFRQPGEVASSNEKLVKSQALTYVNIPVDRASPSASAVQQLRQTLQHEPGPFFLHCGTGIRAITLYLLHQAQVEGWSAERTLDEAKKHGYDLAGAADLSGFVRQYLA